jgi:acylphosphatase
MKRITAIANGTVQGVGYRYYVSWCARYARIRGYVKNQRDGTVIVVAEGYDEALDAFISKIRNPDDPRMIVTSLFVTEGDPTGEFFGFGIQQ